MIVYKIILILLKIILFSLQTLGVWYIIHNIPKWIKMKNGASAGIFETVVTKDMKDRMDSQMIKRTPMFDSGGLVGKTIKIGGEECVVLGVHLGSYNFRKPENSMTNIIVYRRKTRSLGTYSVNRKTDKELYLKYNKTGPVRSREIRRDVRLFCNNSCIQDCTECILKKYGKGYKAE